jgi:hypothetical protein
VTTSLLLRPESLKKGIIMKYVYQRGDCDCEYAVAAMLADMYYEEMWLLLNGEPDRYQTGRPFKDAVRVTNRLTHLSWQLKRPSQSVPNILATYSRGALLLREEGERLAHWVGFCDSLIYDPDSAGRPKRTAPVVSWHKYHRNHWPLIRILVPEEEASAPRISRRRLAGVPPQRQRRVGGPWLAGE